MVLRTRLQRRGLHPAINRDTQPATSLRLFGSRGRQLILGAPVAGELDAFAKVALYLKDPLVLSGFVVFVGFLGLRQLLNSGVIPVLQQGQGFKILRLILSYGFVLGLAIVLLGMGLKYRELSEGEQRRAAALVASELEANATVVSELGKNTNSCQSLAKGSPEFFGMNVSKFSPVFFRLKT